MTTLEKLRQKPISDLLLYKDALESLASRYENELMPMFGRATMFDSMTTSQQAARGKLDKVNSYLAMVYLSLDIVTFETIDKEESKKANTLTEETKVEKKKRASNVKKTNKKT